ncbi:MAG: MgtC/SapB family protein [Turneriella sp.]|nr:MgtC/SapB family protein [Turneriella sp.]
MTTAFATLKEGMSCGAALARIRRKKLPPKTLSTLYVIDKQWRIVGVLTLEELVLANPQASVRQIMNRNIVSVSALEDRKEAIAKIAKYNLMTIPVLNKEEQIIGVITADDAIDALLSASLTGIGFLGAGVIMKDGLSVQGLNTAATIWCSAAVGSLAGVGLSWQAVFVACSVILVHIVLRPLGAHLNRLPVEREDSGLYIYFFKIRCREQVENHLRVLILNALKADEHLQLRSLRSAEDSNPAYVYIEAEIHAHGRHDAAMEKLAGTLTLEYGVTEVSWRKNGEGTE